MTIVQLGPEKVILNNFIKIVCVANMQKYSPKVYDPF